MCLQVEQDEAARDVWSGAQLDERVAIDMCVQSTLVCPQLQSKSNNHEVVHERCESTDYLGAKCVASEPLKRLMRMLTVIVH